MIDTKALRSRVLDLAIQGKLTEQLESDGTAEDLLHSLPKVSTKRAGLLKKNISCNIDYDVPDNWALAKLGEISSYGDAPKKAVVSECDADTWILELEEIQAGGKLLTKKRVGNSTSIGEKTHFKAGQVLYSKLRPYLKKVLVVDEDGICTPEIIAFDVYADIDPNYMVFYLINSYVDKAINDRSYGVKMPRVDAAFMVNLPIPIPPLAEQKRIVARVEEIFRLLDAIDAAQEQYAADTVSLKAKLITAGIQGRLTEQLASDGTAEELYQQIQAEKQRLIKEGKIKREKPLPEIKPEEIPFEIPVNWKWVRLGDIGSTNIGLTYHPADVSNTGTIVIRSSNIQNGKMDYSDIVRVDCKINDNQYLRKNDIVICARNGSKALVGKNAIYDGESNKVAFGAFMAVYRTVCFKFIYYYFNTYAFKRYFSGDDSKQINQVTQAILKESIVPLPPLAEQKRIAETLERVLGVL